LGNGFPVLIGQRAPPKAGARDRPENFQKTHLTAALLKVEIAGDATNHRSNPMYKIILATGTDYAPSNDREELQSIADDLNRDALACDIPKRWIVVLTVALPPE
jgi:hypothetical protein